MRYSTVLIWMLAASVLALGLAGCGSKITKDNYDKIKVGMTEDEVKDILGEPTKAVSGGIAGLVGGGVMTWEDGQKSIVVTFANGKVSLPPVQKGL